MISKPFAIAVSFPNEHREFVLNVVNELAKELGKDRIFYDEWLEPKLVGIDGDLKLRRYYREQSFMIVPFFSKYYQKPWCGIEWSAIRSLLLDRRKDDLVIPVALDDTVIEGWETTDFAIRLKQRTPGAIAQVILKAFRYRERNSPTSEQATQLIHLSEVKLVNAARLAGINRPEAAVVRGRHQLLLLLLFFLFAAGIFWILADNVKFVWFTENGGPVARPQKANEPPDVQSPTEEENTASSDGMDSSNVAPITHERGAAIYAAREWNWADWTRTNETTKRWVKRTPLKVLEVLPKPDYVEVPKWNRSVPKDSLWYFIYFVGPNSHGNDELRKDVEDKYRNGTITQDQLDDARAWFTRFIPQKIENASLAHPNTLFQAIVAADKLNLKEPFCVSVEPVEEWYDKGNNPGRRLAFMQTIPNDSSRHKIFNMHALQDGGWPMVDAGRKSRGADESKGPCMYEQTFEGVASGRFHTGVRFKLTVLDSRYVDGVDSYGPVVVRPVVYTIGQ